MTPIKTTGVHLFDSGKYINEGDLFIASIDSVEGRRRVTLTKVESKEEHTEQEALQSSWEPVRDDAEYEEAEICPLCYEKFDGKKKHGSWCK